MPRRVIEVAVIGDADSLKKTLRGSRAETKKWAKDIDGASRGSSKFKAGLAGVAKGAGVASAAIGTGLVVAARESVKAFAEAERVSAQTTATIKSTGGAANVTAKQVSDLASAISRKSGIDDEAIQSGENLLLTFTKVRNEAGKGNKVFDRATRVVTDMSVALGQDMKSGAIQVGKALNDPIEGVTALQRVGVSFTAQQKDQIAALVESGQQLKAQKLILKELNTEFGGSAAAAGKTFEGSMNKAKVAVGNLGEVIGAKLAPLLERGANAFTGFVQDLEAGRGTAGRVATVVSSIAKALDSLPKSAQIAIAAISATTAAAAAGGLAFGPYGALAAGAAVAIAGAATLIISNWDKIGPVVKRVTGVIGSSFNQSKGDLRALGRAFSNIGVAVKAVFLNVVLPVVRRVMPGVAAFFQGGLRTIGGILKVFSGVFTGDWRRVWSGVKQIFSGALKSIGGYLRAASGPMREAASRIGQAIKGVIGGAFNALRRIVGSVIKFVLSMIDKFLGGISSMLRVAGKIPGIGDKFDGLASAVDRAREKVRGLRDGINRVPKKVDVSVNVAAALRTADKLIPPEKLLGSGDPRSVADKIKAKAGLLGARAAGRYIGNHPALFQSPLGTGITGAGGRFRGGTWKWANKVAGMFGLHATSSYRDPAHNAAVGGVPNSLHTHGSPSNPGAIDMVGPTGAMNQAAAWARANIPGIQEVLVHNVGSGLHLHLGFFAKGGKALMDQMAIVGEQGPELVSLPAGAQVFSHSRSKRMVSAAMGMVPGFKDGGFAPTPINIAADAARQAGFKGSLLRTMIAIAGRESGYNPRAQNLTPPDHSIGLWQINQLAHKGRFGSDAQLMDPYANARAAYALYKASGLSPWKGGSYSQWMDDARAALLATRGGSRSGGAGGGSSKPKEKPEHGRSLLNLDEAIELNRTSLTRAEGTKGTGDDVKAIRVLRAHLGDKAKKMRERLAKINKALQGKLKPSTRNRLLDERAGIFGELGSILGERISLRDQQRQIGTDKKTAAREKAERRSEALSGIKDQLGDLASQAASAWRQGVEKGIDDGLKAKLAAIAGGPDSTLLNFIRGRQSAREDAQNERDLAKAQGRLDRARAAGASPRRLEQLEADVDDAQVRILEKRVQKQEDAANDEADAAREGLDQQESDLKASLDRSLGALFGNLEKRKLAYASFVEQVRAILGPFGVGFESSKGDAAAIGGPAKPKASNDQLWGKAVAKDLWERGIKSGPKWATPIRLLGFDPRTPNGLNFRGFARGGTTPGGWVMVGEEGPELARLPMGTRVHSSQESRKMVERAGATFIHNGDVNVNNRADMERWAQRVAFKVRTAA